MDIKNCDEMIKACEVGMAVIRELDEYRKIGTVQELKRLKELSKKIDFEKLSRLQATYNVQEISLEVNFAYNKLLNKDEVMYVLVESIKNLLYKEAEHGYSESD